MQARFYHDAIIYGSFQHIRSVKCNDIKMYEFDEDGRITLYNGVAVTDIERRSYQYPVKITLSSGAVYDISYDSAGRVTKQSMIGIPTSLLCDYTYQDNNYYPSGSSILMTMLMGVNDTRDFSYSNYKFNTRGDYIERTVREDSNRNIEHFEITYWDNLPEFNSWEWEITPGRYNHIDDFSEGLAKVSLGPYKGFINKKGTITIPALVDYGWDVGNFHNGLAYVADKEHLGYIDKTGKVIIPSTYKRLDTYPYGKDFNNGIAIVYIGNKQYYIDVNNGKILSSGNHGYIHDFCEGLGKTNLGYIDTSGNYIYRFEEGHTGSLASRNGLLVVGKLQKGSYFDYEKAALIDKTGKMLIEFDDQNLKLIGNPQYVAACKHAKWGVVDLAGNVVIPFEYDGINTNYNNRGNAQLEKGDSTYFFDKEMRKLPKHYPKGTASIVSDNLIRYKNTTTGLYGLSDFSGKIMQPAEFEYIYDESEGFIGFVKDKKVGYMDKTGAIAIPPVYDRIFDKWVQSFHDGMAVVCIGKFFGVISADKHAGTPKPKAKTTGTTRKKASTTHKTSSK